MRKLTPEEKKQLKAKLDTAGLGYQTINFRNDYVLGRPLSKKCPECGHSLYEIIVEKASLVPEVPGSYILGTLRNIFAYSLGIFGFFLWKEQEQKLSPRRQKEKQVVCRNCRKAIS